MMAISQAGKRAGHKFGVAASIDGDAGYGTAMGPLVRSVPRQARHRFRQFTIQLSLPKQAV